MTYLLVPHDGADMIHRKPATENCQLDDSEREVEIGQDTGDNLIANGTVDMCSYCFPMDERDG